LAGKEFEGAWVSAGLASPASQAYVADIRLFLSLIVLCLKAPLCLAAYIAHVTYVYGEPDKSTKQTVFYAYMCILL